MATRSFKIAKAMAMVAMLCIQLSSAQLPPCSTANIAGLTSCLGFITGNSSSAPSPACCSQLAAIVQSQAPCFCSLINSGATTTLGAMINQTQAITLPGACKIQAPTLSQCNAVAGAPAASPDRAPAPDAGDLSDNSPSVPSTTTTTSVPMPSGSSPAAPPIPSVPTAPSGGSKTVPATGQSSAAAGSSTGFTSSLILALLLVASYVSSLGGF